jgi:hypothetical protein
MNRADNLNNWFQLSIKFYRYDDFQSGGVTNCLIRGREDSAASKVSPKFSDGTGREPAVAEMSRPVPARTAISIPFGWPPSEGEADAALQEFRV